MLFKISALLITPIFQDVMNSSTLAAFPPHCALARQVHVPLNLLSKLRGPNPAAPSGPVSGGNKYQMNVISD